MILNPKFTIGFWQNVSNFLPILRCARKSVLSVLRRIRLRFFCSHALSGQEVRSFFSKPIAKFGLKTQVIVFSAFYLLFAVSLCSCESFRRKFVRKSKKEKEIKVIIDTQEYPPQHSVEEMYQQYYSFWLTAHNELEELLDTQETNHKRVMSFALKVEENLAQMRELLTGEKQEGLNACIAEQKDIIRRLNSGGVPRGQQLQIKSTLNKQRKKVQEEFAYQYIKDYIKKAEQK